MIKGKRGKAWTLEFPTKRARDTYVGASESLIGYSAVCTAPADVAQFMRARYDAHVLEQEHFWVIGLDSRQRVRHVWLVGMGSLAQVDIHPREAFVHAMRNGVHSVILCHNHPSGSCDPSEADTLLTRRMLEVGKLVGIPVLDHVIVAGDKSLSLASMGLLS